MKKLFVLLTLCFMFTLSLGATTVFAEEMETSVSSETITELEEIDEYTANITKGVVAIVLGFVGTSAAAVAFRKQLKGLLGKVLTAIGLLKTSKEKNEQELDEIKQDVKKTIASLKKVKEEVVDSTKADINKLIKVNQMLIQGFMYLASGTNELVVNGTSETINNLLKELNKETVENEG